MPAAPLPADEAVRLATLQSFGILDTPPAADFDALVRAASLACGVPIALVSLVDQDRQWFKANVGLPGVNETPRDLAFCGYTILAGDLVEIPDATQDPRVADNALVTGPPFIRFYAGVPLHLGDGSAAGTLCVIDHEPRALNATQRDILRSLGQAVVSALGGWRARKLQQQTELALATEHRRLSNILTSTGLGTWEWNVRTDEINVNQAWATIVGWTLEDMPKLSSRVWHDQLHPDDAQRGADLLQKLLAGEIGRYDVELRVRHRDGSFVWVLVGGAVVTRTADGRPEWVFGTRKDISARKRAEEALRKSEEFLDRIGRTAGVGGWELDFRTNVLHCSAEIYRLHGLAADVQPTLEIALQWWPPEAAGVLHAAITRSGETGEGFDLEVPLTGADGCRRWMRAAGSVTCEDGKPVRLTGALQDVTELVARRLELQQANERIKLATDSGGIGIWDWDIRANLLTWDAWMYRLYGQEPGDGVGTYDLWRRHLHPDDRAVAEAAVADAVGGRAPYDVEFRVVWDDGSVHHLRGAAQVTRTLDGQPLRMVGVNWDVTESHRLAAELTRQIELQAEASERETAVFRNNPDGLSIIRVDEADGEPVFVFEAVNPAMCQVSGWQPEDFIGRRIEELLPPDAARAAITQCRACVEQNATISFAVTLDTPNGRRDLEGSRAPIRHPGSGKIVRIASSLRDVTERRLLEAASHHGQKMEAIGRLASGVAHDFNNILQSISASLELVQDEVPVGTSAHEYAAIGRRAAKRGSYLTHHLLSYARKQMLQPRDMDLPILLADLKTLLARTLGPSINVTVQSDPSAKTIHVDPGQIQTALLNLAINASHAMPRGGALHIDASVYAEGAQNWVKLTVTDTGTGMDDATLARAVEPFFTTKGVNGTGLGLSMVHGFAEQSGGHLHITSAPGKGTSITLLLPSVEASPSAPAERPVAARREGIRILLVDDDADVLITTGAFLEKAGFVVDRVANADLALARAAEGAPIDAVITDYAMPGMNGADLLAELRSARPHLPAIIISGYSELADSTEPDEHTVRLHKPFQRDSLIEALQRLLGHHAGIRPPASVTARR
jgi:PAS domain S-box-containing protein